MKPFALCLFIALVTVALLMPVTDTAGAEPAAAFYQYGCQDDLCIYPVNFTDTMAEPQMTCTLLGLGGVEAEGVEMTNGDENNCAYFFNLLNLPSSQRQFVTGDSLDPGIVGYRITTNDFVHTFPGVGLGWHTWIDYLPTPPAAPHEMLPGGPEGNEEPAYPQTYCRYWGATDDHVDFDGECDQLGQIALTVASQDYDYLPLHLGFHSSNPSATWDAVVEFVVRGDPDECQSDLQWNFNSSLEEWAALNYARSSTVGHNAIGSLWYHGFPNNANTTLTAVELQTRLGTSSLIESDDVFLSFWYKGQVDGITNNGITAVIYYTNGGFDQVAVNATDSWQQAFLVADDGKFIQQVRFFSTLNTTAELHHWIDDIVLSVPCANYTPDGTPTPTPPPTGTPAPTATPPPPTPIPNPGGDPIPLPGTGPVSGCYRCEKPARLSISFFGQWITYLACVIWNIFSCSVRIWFMNVVNSVLGVWQSLRGLIMWLPTGLQYIMDWTAGLAGDFLNYLLSFWDKFRAAFTNIPRRLVEMIIQSEPVQAVWRFATWLEGLWLVIKATFQAVLSVIRNVYEGVVGFIHMLIGLANAVRQAWATPAYEIDFIPGEGGAGEGFSQPELLESGPNNTKIYWLIITAMAAFDTVLAGFGLEYIQFIAIGILSLIVIAWTLNQWRDILPI